MSELTYFERARNRSVRSCVQLLIAKASLMSVTLDHRRSFFAWHALVRLLGLEPVDDRSNQSVIQSERLRLPMR